MEITITPLGIGIAVLILLATVLGVYLIIALKNINNTTLKINALLDANRKNIDDTLNVLPEITENINEITSSLKDKTEMLDDLFSKKNEVAASDSNDIESLISSITSVIDLFTEITGFFKKGKRGFFKK